mmetsp:Transcript_5903/g.13351  ORF Transcript_5903/g.13351 Transcript_5903/m.13351 type:complete len:223 (-) Transcript_5903:722-1390(-)
MRSSWASSGSKQGMSSAGGWLLPGCPGSWKPAMASKAMAWSRCSLSANLQKSTGRSKTASAEASSRICKNSLKCWSCRMVCNCWRTAGTISKPKSSKEIGTAAAALDTPLRLPQACDCSPRLSAAAVVAFNAVSMTEALEESPRPSDRPELPPPPKLSRVEVFRMLPDKLERELLIFPASSDRVTVVENLTEPREVCFGEAGSPPPPASCWETELGLVMSVV